MCDAATAAKRTALGKEAIQKPERSLPGWLGQAGTYIPTGGLYAG